VSNQKKLEFYSETRHAFGRSALLLSGGAGLGLYHCGVLKSLYEEGLLPRIIAGTSIGSIFAALVSCKKPEELMEILIEGGVDFTAFYKKGNKGSYTRKIKRFFNEGVIMDIKVLNEFVRDQIGDLTF